MLALALALALACGGEAPRAVAGPDILLVTLDTLRRDHVGAYGSPLGLTPALDALAAEGLVHDAAYTTMPTTGPAHLSLFTGLLPSEHGSRRNGAPLPLGHLDRELATRLRGRGYATASFVTTPLIAPRATGLRGFEIYDAPREPLRAGSAAVEAALAWLSVERRRPVLLWVHLYDPHAPYGAPEEKRPPVEPRRYGWVDALDYRSEAAREEMARAYARGVRAADAALGALRSGVRQRLEREPLVVVVADHGESLAEHLETRGFAYDHGEFLDPETLAIPLVIAGPGVAPGRSPAAVSIRDLYTTLLEAAGVSDSRAETEGRRDLRRRSEAPRIVLAERRQFAKRPRESVRAHRVAATDGRELVVVDGEGRPAAAGPREDLKRAARRLAGGPPPEETASEIAPETREALRQLGYAE